VTYEEKLDLLLEAVEYTNRRLDEYERQLAERDRQDRNRSDSERQPMWPGDPIGGDVHIEFRGNPLSWMRSFMSPIGLAVESCGLALPPGPLMLRSARRGPMN
jgi:hypothetical protein